MDIGQFGQDRTGELVPVHGVPEVTHAFVPNPLPPAWKWPSELWPLLLDARTALASLDGIGKHLPNPELVLRPLQNREAQRSSSLEGTITDPRQQALFQIDPKYPDSRDDVANAHREVFNYGRALRLRFEKSSDLPLSLRLIRELHAVLMDGVRGEEHDPGQFRRIQNLIGRPPRFVPPPVNYVLDLVGALEKYLHQERPLNPLVEAFLVHYQLEAIHPFRDGNGRVGRLFLSILIAEWCGLSRQWLYMSDFFDRNKDEYIDRLFRISTVGDWRGWVEFCLRGTVIQAKDTEQRCEGLLALKDEFDERIRGVGGSSRLSGIVDDLFMVPVVRASILAKQYKVTYNTARSDLAKLERAGIVENARSQRPRVYYCPKIFDITYNL